MASHSEQLATSIPIDFPCSEGWKLVREPKKKKKLKKPAVVSPVRDKENMKLNKRASLLLSSAVELFPVLTVSNRPIRHVVNATSTSLNMTSRSTNCEASGNSSESCFVSEDVPLSRSIAPLAHVDKITLIEPSEGQMFEPRKTCGTLTDFDIDLKTIVQDDKEATQYDYQKGKLKQTTVIRSTASKSYDAMVDSANFDSQLPTILSDRLKRSFPRPPSLPQLNEPAPLPPSLPQLNESAIPRECTESSEERSEDEISLGPSSRDRRSPFQFFMLESFASDCSDSNVSTESTKTPKTSNGNHLHSFGQHHERCKDIPNHFQLKEFVDFLLEDVPVTPTSSPRRQKPIPSPSNWKLFIPKNATDLPRPFFSVSSMRWIIDRDEEWRKTILLNPNDGCVRVVGLLPSFSKLHKPAIYSKPIVEEWDFGVDEHEDSDTRCLQVGAKSTITPEDLHPLPCKQWGKTATFPVVSTFLEKLSPSLSRTEYVHLISTFTSTSDGAEKAEQILRHMLFEYNAGRSTVRPDGGCYNKVLHAYANKGNACKAEEIMQLMCDIFETGDKFAEPNNRHYTTLIFAWQKSNDPSCPDRCEQILEKMHQIHERGVLTKCKPDAFSYTSVLHCWANSDRPDAALHAERLFRKMLERHANGDASLCPDSIAYSNMINVFIKNDKCIKAETILWELVESFLKGNVKCMPSTRNFNSVLAAWSASNSVHSPQRAETIIRKWLHLVETEEITAKPDNYSYCLLLKSWCESSRSDTPDHVDATLAWMHQRAILGDVKARLDCVKGATALKAYVKFKEYSRGGLLVHKLFDACLAGQAQPMLEFRMLSKIITGCCTKGYPQEADALLRRTWKFHKHVKGYRSTDPLLQVVMKYLSDSGKADAAVSLLETMRSFFDSGELADCPSVSSYRMAIAALTHSRRLGNDTKVSALQTQMEASQSNGISNEGGCARIGQT